MFKVYKKIKEKREKQNKEPVYRKIKENKEINIQNISEYEKFLYKLKTNKKVSLKLINTQKFLKESFLTTDNLLNLLNLLFKMWMETADILIYNAIKRLCSLKNIKLIEKDVFLLFKINIQMKKMTDNFYDLFFKICRNEIKNEKEGIMKIIHMDYKIKLEDF